HNSSCTSGFPSRRQHTRGRPRTPAQPRRDRTAAVRRTWRLFPGKPAQVVESRAFQPVVGDCRNRGKGGTAHPGRLIVSVHSCCARRGPRWGPRRRAGGLPAKWVLAFAAAVGLGLLLLGRVLLLPLSRKQTLPREAPPSSVSRPSFPLVTVTPSPAPA